jgi:hypothetical protein
VQAAKEGKRCPTGRCCSREVYRVEKLDADKKPVTGSDGLFVPDKLSSTRRCARTRVWGQDFPEMLRNEDWNYACFTTDKQQRPE